jgi:hypothetical protein
MDAGILNYPARLEAPYRDLADVLLALISHHLPDATLKIWHRHPVWFLEGNPIVGISMQKRGLRLMFWSGADFDEPQLDVRGKNFKDASRFYSCVEDVVETDLVRWLEKSRHIQWDYQNIVKRKGVLVRIATHPSNE